MIDMLYENNISQAVGIIEGFLEEINTELILKEGAGVRASVAGREGGSLTGSEWEVPETEQ